MLRLSFAFSLLLIGLACDTNSASCDLRAVEDDEPRCQERTGIQGTPLFSEFCDPIGGEGVNGPCPDEDLIVAGCKDAAPGGSVIDWYYLPMTPQAIEAICDEDGFETVTP